MDSSNGLAKDLAQIVNTMVTQLGTLSSEVARVARRLGGQADVKGASGTSKDLADHMSAMASNLTGQVHSAKPASVVALQT